MRSTTILLFILLFSSMSARAQHRTAAGKSLSSVIDSLIDAGLKRDVAAIDRLYAEDFTHVNPNGSVMSKSEVLAIYKAPAPPGKIESSTHNVEKIKIFGDTAIVTDRAIIKGIGTNQKPFDNSYRLTYVFRKTGHRWLIVASHASLIL